MACNPIKCTDDEIEVEEGCCPVCRSKWVTAVDPNPEGVMGEPLDLTCRLEGAALTVVSDSVKW